MQTLLFLLSKFINPFFSPIFLVCLICGTALFALRKTGRYPFLTLIGTISLGLLFLFSLPLVSNGLASLWETKRPEPESLLAGDFNPYDSIILLGGPVSVDASWNWHIETGKSMERVTGAARLYRLLIENGQSPTIIVTGGSGNPANQSLSEAPLIKELLILMGVPHSAILQEQKSRNTYENAVFTKIVMEEKKLRSPILITSALHMRRSQAIFTKAGYTFTPFTVDTIIMNLPFPNNVLPDTEALDNSYRTIREMIGYAAYRFLGRL